MLTWGSSTNGLKDCLNALSVRDASGSGLAVDAAFSLWRDCAHRLKRERNIAFFIGNGASASMASHVSADLAKNAHLHTSTFTDLSLITAIGNDLCFEEVFAEPLRRSMRHGDLLVAISSSGKSPNVLRAVQVARELGGFVSTLSAMDERNALRSMGDLNFYIPAQTYGMAETCHAAILHFWVDLIISSHKE